MSDVLAHVLAKSGAPGERGVRLSAHTGQVLARLAAWRRRYRELSVHAGRADLWHLAAWACLLHDVGKIARGFQAMLRGEGRFGHRHEVLSLVAVGWLDLDDDSLGLVAAGVATHHRDLSHLKRAYPWGSQDRTDLLAQLSPAEESHLRRWLGGEGAPRLEKLDFRPLPPLLEMDKAESLSRAFRALLLLEERVRDADALTPAALAARCARGLVLLADHAGSAEERLADPAALRSARAFLETCPPGLRERPWPHQERSAHAGGNVLLIAPTGSGKTEAALLWAAEQRRHEAEGRTVFYVLPYRASLNAMRSRLEECHGLSHGEIVLQHASATAALYAQLLAKGYTSERAATVARHERSLARLMTAAVRVLTPYQLLRAFFGARGHEATLTDAAGGLFVLDELHAYDLRRLALVLAAVEHLSRDLGCRFFAMSATFPRVLRVALLEVLGGDAQELWADRETQAAFRRHRLRMTTSDLLSEETVNEIVARVDAGEAVLAVATTVARAQSLYDALQDRVRGGNAALLHSRFTLEDRNAKERALGDRLGTRRRSPGCVGTVLVATQVVEVSLDVDFDVLYTDPAPIEALVQRFGRVNRGLRGGSRDVVVCASVPPATRWVYDERLVRVALDILTPHDGRAVEEWDVQTWVDAAYSPIEARWREALAREIENVRRAVLRTNYPLESHPELEERFEELFDGAEVVPGPLRAEYERRLGTDPLLASFLRVPVSHGQRAALSREGRLERVRADPPYDVALVPYDSSRGLDLSREDARPP